MIGVIVGAGRIGFNLAKSMAEDHDITIIEKDKTACQKLDEIDCYIIQGSGTNTIILEEADVPKSDFFVAATGNDEVNLLSSVYAKEHGVKIIVARVNNMQHNEIFKKLNIRTVNTEQSAMRYIARTIIRPRTQRLVNLGKGNAEIIELEVKNSNLIYTPIHEIENNSNKFKIVTVYSGKEVIIPTENTEIGYDDSIAVLVKQEYIDEIHDYFTKETE
ncbi:MAG: TrkA family potassium uptake protein [Methanosphaera sp.]|uniref:potassium channel family protein n=1 Tax=Methanosphaera sp. ISO3-F5 TaxID=1452353 RepID=UPI002B261C7B|nr:TrkA family potassium uptake protein [Methanosphaera sp. ISO3-F5]MBR0471968.1 TrkA family potassium uptake protein [Methanosphaera sp.]WQH64491.1 TrkA family potassium uptake protein [Methanosphaera sp. ISO3-F5]